MSSTCTAKIRPASYRFSSYDMQEWPATNFDPFKHSGKPTVKMLICTMIRRCASIVQKAENKKEMSILKYKCKIKMMLAALVYTLALMGQIWGVHRRFPKHAKHKLWCSLERVGPRDATFQISANLAQYYVIILCYFIVLLLLYYYLCYVMLLYYIGQYGRSFNFAEKVSVLFLLLLLVLLRQSMWAQESSTAGCLYIIRLVMVCRCDEFV